MADQYLSLGTRAARRVNDIVETIPLVGRLLGEARCDSRSPWFLQDVPHDKRHLVVILYGASRRSGAMLRIAFLVIRSWWKRPLEPEIVSNGSRLISNSLGGVSKPVLWMASVGIAGAVGSDFGNSSSNLVSSRHVVIWISSALGLALCLAVYHWWRLLDRLRRVLITWVSACNSKNIIERKTDDIALFGYTFGDSFRLRFNARGVKFLSILTFSATIFIIYRFGQQS